MIRVFGADWANVNFQLRAEFLRLGKRVNRQEWQSMQDDRPHTKVFEVQDVSIHYRPFPRTTHQLQEDIKPSLPWAEDHFRERVEGYPLNPGDQYRNWPWYAQGVEEHKRPGVFSHTYMERFWPRFAGKGGTRDEFHNLIDNHSDLMRANKGIRFKLGSLSTVTALLRKRPYTRQAVLTIWFPEDPEAALMGERVPCSLSYHFLATPPTEPDGVPLLSVKYSMRSVDYFRYLRDDLYMACRLGIHVAEATGMIWNSTSMNISNLHIFENEMSRLQQEHDLEQLERLGRL